MGCFAESRKAFFALRVRQKSVCVMQPQDGGPMPRTLSTGLAAVLALMLAFGPAGAAAQPAETARNRGPAQLQALAGLTEPLLGAKPQSCGG
jgi:hypothetical protein